MTTGFSIEWVKLIDSTGRKQPPEQFSKANSILTPVSVYGAVWST